MASFMLAFSFDIFFGWLLIGLACSFIIQNTDIPMVSLGALSLKAAATLGSTFAIICFLLFVGGSMVTLIAVFSFGLGMLLELIFSLVFIHIHQHFIKGKERIPAVSSNTATSHIFPPHHLE